MYDARPAVVGVRVPFEVPVALQFAEQIVDGRDLAMVGPLDLLAHPAQCGTAVPGVSPSRSTPPQRKPSCRGVASARFKRAIFCLESARQHAVTRGMDAEAHIRAEPVRPPVVASGVVSRG
jgi:hypothetical protein